MSPRNHLDVVADIKVVDAGDRIAAFQPWAFSFTELSQFMQSATSAVADR